MIRPPGFAGAVFGTATWGDLRVDEAARVSVSATLGIPSQWAFVNQVHGATVLEAHTPGELGDADAIVTTVADLPIAIATADCVPMVIEAQGAVAVVHAGWRGAIAGILPAAMEALHRAGHRPRRVAIGPAIGSCCYEVGTEVADQFPGYVAKTEWGTTSVDIASFLANQIRDVEVWRSDECTFTSTRMNSWRRDQTRQRQVTVAWLPSN